SDGDSYEDMQAYAKEQGYQWFYAVDKNNELADAFGANRTPECYLFDKSGKLVYHGAIDDNPADASRVNRSHLKEAINELTTGKDVSVKESRSVGCGIKRI
ncbi:MAG TPA: thioredoxin family protein, partial [Chitinophagaceae bacterium]|nr:thioredoxin family protein [Chitinophagaceae bacterium]